MRLLLIGLLGAVGALARYELSRAVHRLTSRNDLATMIVNISGAVALGFVVGIDSRARIEPHLLAAVTIGFLGGFTTFSTWMVDVIVLSEERRSGKARAVVNLAVTLGGGLAAYLAGRSLASMLA